MPEYLNSNVSHVSREQIAISSTAKTLTALSAANTAKHRYTDVQVLTNNIRVTFDGTTAPVGATTGTIWYASKIYRIWGSTNYSNLKMIRDTADATVVVDNWGSA